MKKEPEMIEGTEAFENFKNVMKQVLSVPHDEVQKRIEEHRKEAAANPNRRGPKTKKRKPAKASASRDTGVS
jgi:hypothetical protein